MRLKRINGHNDGMTINQKGECFYASFPSIDREDWVRNAFSTRFGGVSEGPYASMNLAFSREPDHRENVVTNFLKFAQAVGFDADHMVFTDQQHTDNLLRVGKKDRGNGFLRPRPWKDIDGLITDEPGVVLTIFGADCVPVFLIDPEHHAIGAVHSGWRGTAMKIGAKAVRMMTEEFGSDPSKMLAGIGPSICRSCYEVSADVACQFPEETRVLKEDGKYLLDLHLANQLALMEAGIPESKIEQGNLCTNCNPDIFFSHRASHGIRGVCAGFLEIKE